MKKEQQRSRKPIIDLTHSHVRTGKTFRPINNIIREDYTYSYIYKHDARYRGDKAYIRITHWAPLNNRINFDFTSNKDEAWISKPSTRNELYHLYKEYLKKMGSRLILISADVRVTVHDQGFHVSLNLIIPQPATRNLASSN